MSQENESGLRAFVAGETLEAYRRVKLSSTGTLVYADAGDMWIGTTLSAVASGSPVTVKLRSFPGTRKMIFASSAVAGARCYGADDGKVDDVATGGPGIGTVIDAPGAALAVGEVMLDDVGDKGGMLLANAAASSANALAAATVFSNGTKTINGADLKAGDVLEIHAAGIVGTSTGNETTLIEVLVGTEIVAATATLDTTSADVFVIDLKVVVRVAGSSGKLLVSGIQVIGPAASATMKPICSTELSEDISGAALTITVRSTHSSTGESTVLHSFIVKHVRQ